MAITFIYPIKVTGNKSLDYDLEDKKGKIKKNDSRDSLEYIIRDKRGNVYNLSDEYLRKMDKYISKDEQGNIIFHTVKSSLNCSSENPYIEWEYVRNALNPGKGNKGNIQYCIVQNFGTDIDPEIANEIGMRFAQEYLNKYQVVVTTHINTGYVHNHIEFNSTSFVDGKKFNDNRKTIAEIRKISDRLCEEYNLDVLEDTKEYKYILYKDENGKTKIFEPTDRKLNGEFSNNDYRNSKQYENSINHRDAAHYKILQQDIEQVLDKCNSYEELIRELSDIGYDIKSKTAKGEWRKNISFKKDGWDKYLRDSSLDEKYLRENIEKYIKDKNNIEICNNELTDDDIYEYGRIIIDDINEEYRFKNGKKVERFDLERILIKDTKELNREINNIMKKSIRPDKDRSIQNLKMGTRVQQQCINIINNNLRTLKFVEDNSINNFQQISANVKQLYIARNKCYDQVKSTAILIKKLNRISQISTNYLAATDRIKANESNPDYILFEKNNDELLLKECKELLHKYNLNSAQEVVEFQRKYDEYTEAFNSMSKNLENVNRQIMEYDNSMKNLQRINREYSGRYSDEIDKYYEEKENYRYERE